ncbi:unnamed protein product [Arctia plantaginis]|uniref:Uncharacterized protein n=1 Tax=Arctia plantaginis TaxID=874455 RepID=A0A8S1ACG5_ARCPL|nr:unnamed protein product [Arctia plantaginis]
MDPFRPRGSLRRTPPREVRAVGESSVTTPPEVLEMAQAAFDSVIAAASGSPKGIPAYPPTPTFSPAPVGDLAPLALTERMRPAAAKRILSPDTQAETEPKRRTARDLSVVSGPTDLLAPPIVHTPATEYGSPFSSGDEDFLLGDEELGRATTRQLPVKANAACRSIAAVAFRQASRLNKADLAIINGQLRVLAEIVGHCCVVVEGQKTANAGLERNQGLLNEARVREAARASRAEAEAERARAEAAAAAATAATAGTTGEGWQTVNYARALKRAPKAPQLIIPPHPGATLAIYPAEGSDLKTADQTKLVLKKSVEPRELGTQIMVDRTGQRLPTDRGQCGAWGPSRPVRPARGCVLRRRGAGVLAPRAPDLARVREKTSGWGIRRDTPRRCRSEDRVEGRLCQLQDLRRRPHDPLPGCAQLRWRGPPQGPSAEGGSGRARIRTPGTRDTAQASEVGSGWVRPECERAFTTKIGLGVHKRRAHPLTTNIDAAPAQIKRRWREEEVALLAKTEARLVREGVQCTNQELAKILPHLGRTVEAIKGKRRVEYKKAVQWWLDTHKEQTPQVTTTSEEPEPSNTEQPTEPGAPMTELAAPLRSTPRAASVQLQSTETGDADILSELFELAERRNARSVTRKCPSRASAEIIDGQGRGVRHSLDELEAYWRPIIETVSDAPGPAPEALRKAKHSAQHGELVDVERLMMPFSVEEVRASRVDGRSAPGPDGILPGDWNAIPAVRPRLLFSMRGLHEARPRCD